MRRRTRQTHHVTVAVLSPGQGAQKPGFLTPWCDTEKARSTLAWFSELAHLNLTALGTSGSQEEITDTAATQPLLTAASLLAAEHLPRIGAGVITAGHSVGELGAAAYAGALSREAALSLAAVRGRAMADACAQSPTGMTAILGGEEAEVLTAIEKHNLIAANHNSSKQLVAAGSLSDLAALAENPPPKARLRALSVAGAFHTDAMAPAQSRLETCEAGISVSDPHCPVISNRDGEAVTDGHQLLHRIVTQVTSPVRWDLVTETFRAAHVTLVIELPPAGVLAGLAKRALPEAEIIAVNTPEDLERAAIAMASHTEEGYA